MRNEMGSKMNVAFFLLFSLSFSSAQHVYCSIWDYGYGCGANADKYMHEQSLAHRERARKSLCVGVQKIIENNIRWAHLLSSQHAVMQLS